MDEGPPTDPAAEADPDAEEDPPDWIRDAARMEGGIDAVVTALRESGPRTHVSDRSADDVLDEVPDPGETGATETRSEGIDDVLDSLRAGSGPGPGASRTVSDRPIDVFGGDPEAPDPGTDSPGPGSEDDDGPEAGDDTEGTEGEDDAESVGDPAGEDVAGSASDAGQRDLPTAGTDSGPESGSLVGGTPDEVVVEGSVDDIISGRTDDSGSEPQTESDGPATAEGSTAAEPPPAGTEPDAEASPEWEPIPEAPADDEVKSSAPGRSTDQVGDPADTGTVHADATGDPPGDSPLEDSGDAGESDDEASIENLIADPEGESVTPEGWEPVGSDSPIRDAEADTGVGGRGATRYRAEDESAPAEDRALDTGDRALDSEDDAVDIADDAVDTGDDGIDPEDEGTDSEDDGDGVVDRIRDAFDRFRSG